MSAVRFASAGGQFMACFFRGVAARAHGDDAVERCRNRQRHNRRIELERTATATLMAPTK
jgi:hypothetical protein